MFGFNPRLATASKGALGQRERDQLDALEAMIKSQAGPSEPRWATALQGIGASLRDAGAAYDGRPSNALDAFNAQRERVREATEDARRRQMRFQHLRETIPASDSAFWQAYAMGGEEAAMAALQARQGRDFQREMAEADRQFRREEGEAGRAIQREGLGIQRDRLGLERERIDIARDQANRPPEAVRVVDAMGLEGPERDRALRLLTGIEQPVNSRDALIAQIANDVFQRYPDGNIPAEETARLRSMTDAIYQPTPGGSQMSLTDAYMLANTPPEQRAEMMRLMSGGTGEFDPSNMTEEQLQAAIAEAERRLAEGQ